VESHPFALDTMLFMDWRDEHLQASPAMRASNEALPTFLYAMPFSPTKIFLEETSLVARPAVGFQDLKDRLEERMKWLGIKVGAGVGWC
jgi:lycopene beta-cyclase